MIRSSGYKLLFGFIAGSMMNITSMAQTKYAFNISGGYVIGSKARSVTNAPYNPSAAQAGMSLEIFTGPSNSIEVLCQFDIVTPVQRHFNLPFYNDEAKTSIACIMVNEVWYIPVSNDWTAYAALGPGLGIISVANEDNLECLAWDARTGIKRKISSKLSAKVQAQLFSLYYAGDEHSYTANGTLLRSAFSIYRFGVSAGLSISL